MPTLIFTLLPPFYPHATSRYRLSFFLTLRLFLSLFLQLIPYFISLNDKTVFYLIERCDKEQKKESLCRGYTCSTQTINTITFKCKFGCYKFKGQPYTTKIQLRIRCNTHKLRSKKSSYIPTHNNFLAELWVHQSIEPA